MSPRGLSSLLAMPPALRPVLLQAALIPSPSFLPAPTLCLSRTRSYARKIVPSKKKTTSKHPSRSDSKATSRLKKAAGAAATTKPTKPTPKKKPLPSSLPPVEIDSDEGPPPTLSFLPTPVLVSPPSALLADTPPPADIACSTAFFRSPKFLYSAPRFLHLPINTRMPEVCILGRSNVGKSTLINALSGYGGKKAGAAHGNAANRKGLAITSSKAGCTKTMNAYGFGPPASVRPLTREEQEQRKEGGRARSDRRKKGSGGIKPEGMPRHSLVLMDMPGYGLNSRADWGEEIIKYLNRREILSGAVLLVDAVAGVKEGDRMVLEVLRDAGLKTSVVLTKADKLVTEPDPELWQESVQLRQACSHIYEEMRQVEKKGEMDWFEGDGWTPEIFVTGAGDPKMGGMGIDGARLAICRLAGLVAEPVRKVEVQQPEIVPFDQLVFAAPSLAPKYEIQSLPAEEALEKEHVGRGRLRPRRVEKRIDPMKAMEAAIFRPRRGKQLGQASF